MDKNIAIKTFITLLLAAGFCRAEGCVKLPQSCQPENKTDINGNIIYTDTQTRT